MVEKSQYEFLINDTCQKSFSTWYYDGYHSINYLRSSIAYAIKIYSVTYNWNHGYLGRKIYK